MGINISVSAHTMQITKSDTINQGEYNITPCNFVFSEEYNNLIKRAVFFNILGKKYMVEISNNICTIPLEILELTGDIFLGVYAYANNQDGTLQLRYSPSPVKLPISTGSYIPNTETPIAPSATYDYFQELNNLVNEIENDLATGAFTPVKGVDYFTQADIDEFLATVEQDIQPTLNSKQDMLVSGTNIKTINNQSILGEGNIEIETGAVDYEELLNKPSINNVELIGNKSLTDLGIATELKDLTDDSTHRLVTDTEKSNWDNKSNFSGSYNDLTNKPDLSGFIDKNVNDLTYYTLKTNTGSLIDLEINSSTYVVTITLKDQDGNAISTDNIDLPLESVVVGGRYDNTTKKVILTLENGNTVEFSVADLVAGLQTEITNQNKLASDLVDDTNSGNKFVTTSEKSTWNAKYDKPSGGIPSTDLADVYVKPTDYASGSDAGVFKTASTFNTAVSSSSGILYALTTTYANYSNKDSGTFISKGTLENVITGKNLETGNNKVTSISSQSTDTQYPSAKCVYDALDTIDSQIGDISSALDILNGEVV